jgi:cytochrome c-type biogenesis protein
MQGADTMPFMNLDVLIAFASGLLSFFSPCVLPLVPSYLIFISGISFDSYNEATAKKYRKTVLIHALSFIVGFSMVFVALGLSSSFLGSLFSNYQTYIKRLGGLILIVLGLFYLNVVKIPALNQEKVFHLQKKPVGLLGSCIIGITFSLGWTPCIGPALSSILVIASTKASMVKGMYLLSLYSLGLGVPFILSALLFDRLLVVLKRYSYLVRYSVKVMGILFVIIGILFFTESFSIFNMRIGRFFSS